MNTPAYCAAGFSGGLVFMRAAVGAKSIRNVYGFFGIGSL